MFDIVGFFVPVPRYGYDQKTVGELVGQLSSWEWTFWEAKYLTEGFSDQKRQWETDAIVATGFCSGSYRPDFWKAMKTETLPIDVQIDQVFGAMRARPETVKYSARADAQKR